MSNSLDESSWPHGPCAVCGDRGAMEPRFLYFVCAEHESVPPTTVARFVHGDVSKTLDTYPQGLVAGKEAT